MAMHLILATSNVITIPLQTKQLKTTTHHIEYMDSGLLASVSDE